MIVGNLLYSTCDVEPEGSEGSSMILVNCACTSSRPWSNDKSWDGNNLETSKASKRKAAGDSRNLESLLESSNPPLILLFFVFFSMLGWCILFLFSKCVSWVFMGFPHSSHDLDSLKGSPKNEKHIHYRFPTWWIFQRENKKPPDSRPAPRAAHGAAAASPALEASAGLGATPVPRGWPGEHFGDGSSYLWNYWN